MLNALPSFTASSLPAAANAHGATSALRADDVGTPRGGFAGVLNQAKAPTAAHKIPTAARAPATTTTTAQASDPSTSNRASPANAVHGGSATGARVKATGAAKPGPAKVGATMGSPGASGAPAQTPAAETSDEAAATTTSDDASDDPAAATIAALGGPVAPASAALPSTPPAIGLGIVSAPLTLDVTPDPSAAAAPLGNDTVSGSGMDAPALQTALLNGAIAVANAGGGAAPTAASNPTGADEAWLTATAGAGTPDSADDLIATEAAAPGLGTDPALAAAASANAVPAAVAAALAPPSTALPAPPGASPSPGNASASATVAALLSGAGASANGAPVLANAAPLSAAQAVNPPTSGPAGQGTPASPAEFTELAIVPNATAAPLPAEGATANALPNPAAGLSFAAGLADALATQGSGQSAAPTEVQVPASVNSPEFAPALGLTISTLAANGVQEARLQLHPAELGPITVQIALDGSGARVDFQADVAQTRQAIEASLPALAGALREAGLTLTGGGVSQQSPQSGQSGQANGQGARRGRHGLADEGAAAVASVSRATTRRGLVDLMA